MTDTPRTLAALQALLADNTSGDISPQDVRDFLVSVMGAGGPGAEIRPLKNTVNEGTYFNEDTDYTLLNLGAGNAGTVEAIWMVMSFDQAGDLAAMRNSLFKFYFNGEGSPSISIKAKDLFCDRGYPGVPNFWHPYFGKTFEGGNNDIVGGYLRLPMPYQNGCVIKWYCPEGTPNPFGRFWSSVDYHEGATILPLRRQKLKVAYLDGVNVAASAWQDLINISAKGELAGIQFFCTMTGGTTHTFMEGNVEFYRDGEGSYSFHSSGLEDFFFGAFYFAPGELPPQTLGLDQGLLHKGTISGDTWISPFTLTAYRWFLNEKYPFDTGLRIRWQNGDTVRAVTLSTIVWYWVATP